MPPQLTELVAIVRAREKADKRCVACLKTLRAPLVTCWPVLTETAWLLRTNRKELRIYELTCQTLSAGAVGRGDCRVAGHPGDDAR